MESVGTYLRRERQEKRVSLEEISQSTKIPLDTLMRIESDDFDVLPGDVFVRGFLKACARHLKLDPDPILSKYNQSRPRVEEPVAPPVTVPPPTERGRRFGIGIALFILLILFTLALSIVLRPRHREIPVELSFVPQDAMGSPHSTQPINVS